MLRMVRLTALWFTILTAWGCLEPGPVTGPNGASVDAGVGGVADATVAAVESCNGVDDDCDQLVVDGTMHTFLVMEHVEGTTLRHCLGRAMPEHAAITGAYVTPE